MLTDSILENIEIINADSKYVMGFSKMFDNICREKIYLGLQKGLSNADNKHFIEKSLKVGAPFVFVIDKTTKKIIGWSDIQIYGTDGKMGIGLLKAYRNCGLGSYIIGIMIEKAKEIGLKNIILNVRVSNARAIHVYEKFGFKTIKLDDSAETMREYNENILVMKKKLI